MTAITRIIASAGSVALGGLPFLGGCERISERLNGTYEGFMPVAVAPNTDPIVARQLGLVRLIAKEDGTATLSDQGVPIQGEISYGAKSATFLPEKILGLGGGRMSEKIDQYRVELIPANDGSWLYAGKIKLVPKQNKLATGSN